MTIREALDKTDNLVHNIYSRGQKLDWLSGLDLEVKQLLDTAEDAQNVPFAGYTELTPDTMVLLVPAPFDEAYLRYLEAQIHYHNGEYDKYNNAMAMFRTVYDSFANYHRRTRMPQGWAMRYW